VARCDSASSWLQKWNSRRDPQSCVSETEVGLASGHLGGLKRIEAPAGTCAELVERLAPNACARLESQSIF